MARVLPRVAMLSFFAVAVNQLAAQETYRVQSKLVEGRSVLELFTPEYDLSLFEFGGMYQADETIPFPRQLPCSPPEKKPVPADTKHSFFQLKLGCELPPGKGYILVLKLASQARKKTGEKPYFLKLQFDMIPSDRSDKDPIAQRLEKLGAFESERLPTGPTIFCHDDYWQGFRPCFQVISVDVSGIRTGHDFVREPVQESEVNQAKDRFHAMFETEMQVRKSPGPRLRDAPYAWLTRLRFKLDRSRILAIKRGVPQAPDVSIEEDQLRLDSDLVLARRPFGFRKDLTYSNKGRRRWLSAGLYIGAGAESQFFKSTRKLEPGDDPTLNVTQEVKLKLPRPARIDPQLGFRLQGSNPNHFAKFAYAFGGNLRSFHIDPQTLAVSTVSRFQPALLWESRYDRPIGETEIRWNASIDGRFVFQKDGDQLGETRLKTRLKFGIELPLGRYKLLKLEPYSELLLFKSKIPSNVSAAPNTLPRGVFFSFLGGAKFSLKE